MENKAKKYPRLMRNHGRMYIALKSVVDERVSNTDQFDIRLLIWPNLL